MPQKARIDKRQAVAELWRRGTLKWKLYPHQLEMYDFIHNNPAPVLVIASSRQIGKSTLSTLLAVEECIKKPNSIVKFVAPKVKDIRRIIAPIIRDLTKDCPPDVRPKYNTQDHIYRFPNGSEIQLAGTDNGHAESIRGTKANLCIIDEAGFCDDLDYVVSSVLVPTLTTTGGKIIMISTPSKSPDHPFMEFMAEAEAEGRFIKRTIYDNTMLSREQIKKIAEAIGGEDSVDFKREYLVEKIISEDDAVIPEFTDELQKKIVVETTRPPFFDSYVSMDIGGRDLTVVLFAFYDFLGGRTVIEDELVFNRKILTDELAYAIKEKEETLWAHPITKEPHRRILRVADNNNIILLNDLAAKHEIAFVPTAKDNKIAALNNMRMMLKTGKIIINPRCKTLISHLKGAIWNKTKTDFARSTDKGHYDSVSAMMYLTRNINLTKNPYPGNYSFSGKESVVFLQKEETLSNFERQLVEKTKSFKLYSRWKKN